MAKKMLIAFIMGVLATTATFAQYPNDTTYTEASGVEYYFGIDDFIFPEGGHFNFCISVYNGSADTLEWIFRDSQFYELWLTEEQSGDTVWVWSWNQIVQPIEIPVEIYPDSSMIARDNSAFSCLYGTPSAGDYLLLGKWVPEWSSGIIPTLALPVVIEELSVDKGRFNQPYYFVLRQNFPNPFNSSTAFSFDLPVASPLELKIFDAQGRLVAELVNGWRDAGYHEVTFDGSDLASGVYIYRLKSSKFAASKKLFLLK